jgi:hypothetical protein
MRVVVIQVKNGLSVRVGAIDEVQRLADDDIVGGFHALAGQRAGVFDAAIGKRVDDTARPEPLMELGILGVMVSLGLLFRIEVVEVAVELVEAVNGRQVFIAVAEVVFAELTGGVTLVLQQVTEGRRPVRDPVLGAGHPDGEEARAEGVLTENEGGAPGGAALLGVVVREHPAFAGDPVDVGRFVAHDAVVVCADIVHTDVVAPDDDNVWLFSVRGGDGRNDSQATAEGENRQAEQCARTTEGATAPAVGFLGCNQHRCPSPLGE